MFKVVLLVVLVSVVWSIGEATYILEDNHGYGVLNTDRFSSFHGSLYPSHLSQLDFDDDHHGVVLSDHHSHSVRLTNIFQNSFNPPEASSEGWKPVVRNQEIYKHGPISYQNEHNKQTHGSFKSYIPSQEQIEIKFDHISNHPQSQTKHPYQNAHVQDHILPHGVFHEIPDRSHILSNIISQIGAGKTFSQNAQYDSSNQAKNDNEQVYADTGYKTTSDGTPGTKTNTQDNSEEYKNTGSSTASENSQNNHPDQQNRQLHSNLPIYRVIHGDNKEHSVIYSHGIPGAIAYIEAPENHGQVYTSIPRSSGTTGSIYNLRLAHGAGYPILISGDHIQLGHNIPHLTNSDIHRNLNGQLLYEIRSGAESDSGQFEDIENYNTGENKTENEPIKYDDTSAYSDKQSDNSAVNIEQMIVELGQKSGGGSDSYDIPGGSDSKYPSNKEAQVEQKSLEIGLKSSSGKRSSVTTGSDSQYKISAESDSQYKISASSDSKSYPDNVMQKSIDVEQKTIDEGLKSQTGGYKSSDPVGSIDYSESQRSSVPKYPTSSGKKSESNIEQKQVDVEQKSISEQSNSYSNLDSTESEYPGIGSIDSPKYPAPKLENSGYRAEQKSVEIKSYEEVKSSSYKKDPPGPGIHSSLNKKEVSYTVGEVNKNDNDRNTNFKFNGYEKPNFEQQKNIGIGLYPPISKATSRSYFNTGHSSLQNSGSHKQEQNHPSSNNFQYSSSESPRSGNRGNNYSGNRGIPSFPRGFNSVSTSYRPHLSSEGNKPRTDYGRKIGSSSHNYREPKQSSASRGNSAPHQSSSYAGTGENLSPIHSRIPSISKDSLIPTYQDSVSGGISHPRYSHASDHRKVPLISHNYPKPSPIRSNSYRSTSQNLHPPSSSINYLAKRGEFIRGSHPYNDAQNANTPNTPSYGSVKEASEYPGIGEISTPKLPNPKFSSYSDGAEEYPGIGEISSKIPGSKPSSYLIQQKQNTVVTEQKTYDTQESVETYSGDKDGFEKSPGIEYSGIGEIGSVHSPKSQIVGGRRPIKRPSKISQVKSETDPKRIKGQSEVKSQQKYLPITATLANSGSPSISKPVTEPYGGIKSPVKIEQREEQQKIEQQEEEPEEIEQQELVHEAFLAGEGPQNPGHASSGYGFLKPPAGSHRPRHKDEDLPPMPYEFKYDIEDHEHGSEQYRQEKMDDNGYLTGRYGFKDSEGKFRQVEYEASKEGFKVSKIKTNEPGTDNQDPADVHLEVQKY